MMIGVRELILCLALTQTVSVFAQELSKGDPVVTPHFAGTVEEVINKDQVRVQSSEDIKTTAIYPTGDVAKVDSSEKVLSAREQRLLRARNSEMNFTGISLPGSVLRPTISPNGNISFHVR